MLNFRSENSGLSLRTTVVSSFIKVIWETPESKKNHQFVKVILSRGRNKRPSRTLPEIHDNPTFRYVREVSVLFCC